MTRPANRDENLKRLMAGLHKGLERTAGSGVKLLIEAINTRVDHPGALMDNNSDAIRVIREIGSENLALAYDLYHSVVIGEDPATQLAAADGLVDSRAAS